MARRRLCSGQQAVHLVPPGPQHAPAVPPNCPPQGPVCVDITAKYNTAGVKTTPPYTDAFEPLGDVTTVTHKVG